MLKSNYLENSDREYEITLLGLVFPIFYDK